MQSFRSSLTCSGPRAQDDDAAVGQTRGTAAECARLDRRYGDLQGIARRAMQEIESLDVIMIEAKSEAAE
ncbi:hypothetical protein AS156_18165 [Bradyrhizobium macuxiense]|uniref:Uncharacterized protein n=1 Tax=Bradyrhizobium macuxiense TaxID=1755647 RepID=A0A120FJ21_9BRAD|nr:hypothetical protein AS156_18165 [Bradyrhizobium macuxiense]